MSVYVCITAASDPSSEAAVIIFAGAFVLHSHILQFLQSQMEAVNLHGMVVIRQLRKFALDTQHLVGPL